MHLNFSMRLFGTHKRSEGRKKEKEPEFGCCEASWPTGATSKVRETLLRDLPSPSLTPLRPTTPGDEEGVVNNTQLFFLPLGLVSRDCQDHKGAGDPRQEDTGGASNQHGER